MTWLLAQMVLCCAGLATATGVVAEPRVVVCNDCVSPEQTALASGRDLTVVVDFHQVRLHAFQIRYDAAQQRWRATPEPVPVKVEAAFLRTMELMTRPEAHDASGPAPPPDQANGS